MGTPCNLPGATALSGDAATKGSKMNSRTSTLKPATLNPVTLNAARFGAGTSLKLTLATVATALALIAIPHAAHSQGVFRGAEQGGREGVYQGGRAAGPVGA